MKNYLLITQTRGKITTLFFFISLNIVQQINAQNNCSAPISYEPIIVNSCGSLPGSINLNVSNPSQQDNCQFNEVSLFQVCNAPSIADGIRPTTGEYIVLSGPVGTDISCYTISDGDWVITLPTGSTINENGLFSIGFDINYGENHFDLNLQGCNCATMRENFL